LIAAAALVALTILSAEVQRVAVIYVVAAVAVFIVLRVLASGLMALTRRLPRPRSIPLRLALSNVHRPGALTPTVVLSLGLGLSLLVTLALIEGNLQRQLTSTLARTRAELLLHRYSVRRLRTLRRFRAGPRRRAPISTKCRCCAGASCA
jgi:predicted lysophospholipase L1 biosynthesis ABC-type transport system permease subunit